MKKQKKQKKQKKCSAPIIEVLEPRMLFSADALGALFDAPTPDDPLTTQLDHASEAFEAQVMALQSPEPPSPSRELVVVDSATPDYQRLVDDILAQSGEDREFEVVLLNTTGDGITQLTNILSGYSGLDAVHLISHGSEEGISLGSTRLDLKTLEQDAGAIAHWGDAFSETGDLLIYGCNLASTAEGEQFVDTLAQLTGADVAASDDLTGHESLGGDWELEYETGQVETTLAVSAGLQAQFEGVLADTVLESYQPTSDLLYEVKTGVSWGQTFKHDSAAPTYVVNRLELQLYKHADALSDQTITISLRDSFNGTVLGSDTLSSNDLSTSETWYSFDIGSATLNDNTLYTIQVDNIGDGKVYLPHHSEGSYNNGTLLNKDGLMLSDFDASFKVIDANDAPVLAGANDLTAIAEDPVNNDGTLVSALIFEQITDPDDSSSGIAVIGVDDTNGTWQYTTNGGSNWNAFGAVDASSARLLAADANTSVRFQPDTGWFGTVTNGITFHAWDQTGGTAGGTADLTSTGGSTPFSLASASSDIIVIESQEPTSTNPTLTLNENTTYILSAADFNYSDPQSDPFTQVKIVTLETAGALKFNNIDVIAGQVVSITDINNNLLTFTPGAGEFGAPYATFTYRVHDGSRYSDSVSTAILIDTGFDAGADGFTYGDDSFGTTNPDDATGIYQTTGGQTGGGVRVNLGPGDISVPASGGWSKSFNLTTAQPVTVSLDYRATLSGDNEAGEWVEAIFDLDSTRYGGDLNNSLVHIIGDGTDGPLHDTGWVTATFDIALTAGNHTLTLGAYLADASQSNEWAEVFFDNVQVTYTEYNTMTLNVNDAPTTGTVSASGSEDAASIAIILTGSDLDGSVDSFSLDGLPAYGTLYTDAGLTIAAVTGTDYAATAEALTLYFVPDADYYGDSTFDYVAKDNDGLIDATAATATITVNPVNDVPLTAADSYATNEDTALTTGNVLANDDLGDTPTTITAFDATSTQGGSVVNHGDGTFSYTPPPNFNGDDTFTYTVTDNDGEFSTATVTITVNPVNDVPLTAADSYATNEDTALTTGNVLANDDLGDTPTSITAFDATSTQGGSVVHHGDGTFSYTPPANFNGNDTFTYTVTDNDGEFSTATVTITVNPVNDAPINTVPASIAVTEDVASAVTGLSIADVDAGGAAMRVTLSVPTGSLAATSGGGVTVGGSSSALTLTGTVSDINAFITASNVTYTTAADANGSVTLTVLTSDQGSSGSGGTRTDSDTVTLNISAVNDTPVIAVNSTVTVLEGSTDTVITSAMLNEGDVDDSGAGLTYTLTTAPVNGTLYLSGTALVDNDTFTQADIDAGWVTYDHDGSQTGSDSFDFSLADGGEDGATVVTGTFNFNITNVNDPPVNTVPGAQSVDEDTPLTIGGVSISVNDVDDNLATVKLTVTDGVLNVTLSGATISAGSNGSSSLTLSGSQADINATLVSLTYQGNTHFNGTDTLTVLSTDGSAATDTDTVAITVNAVNDAPINTVPASIAVTEDVASAVTGLSIADVDAGGAAMRVTLSVPTGSLAATSGGGVTVGGSSSALTLTGTVSDINAFITASNVTYTTAADANGSVTLTVLTSDQGSSGSGGTRTDSDTVTLNISAVNDTPVIAVNSTVTVLEGSTDTVITSAMLNEGDVDDSGAGLTYTLTTAPVNGTLYLSGTALVDNDTFTQADIDAGWVTYDHDGSQTGSDSFDFSLADGGEDGATVVTGTFNFNITNVNDPPVNTVPGAQSVDEDTPLTIGGVSISVNDVDDNLATVKLTVTDGVLNVTLSGATISAGSNGSSSLTLSGSQADINATLVSLTYQGNTHFNGTDTLTVLSTDGSAATDTDTVAITVNAVNDAPINTVPASIAVTEDVASAVTGLSIADVDAGGAAMRVTLSVPTGSLAATSGGGVTVGGSSSALTLTGTVSDINAFITASNVTYTTAADANGSVTLTVLTSDQGSSGSGGTRTDSDTVTLNISAVNDTPVIAVNSTVTVLEGSTDTVITSAMLNEGDVDDSGAGLTYTLTSAPVNGTLYLSGTALVDNDTFTQADIDAGWVTYDHDGSQTGSDSFDFSLADGGEDGATVVTGTFNFNITNVNDPPVNTVPGAQSVDEDTPLTIGGVSISVNDVDDNLATVKLTVTDGVLNVTLSGATISTGSNGSSSLTLSGSQADINATLVSLTYQGNTHFNGTDTLTVLSTDGSAATDTDTVAITINAVNDAPINTVPASIAVTEDVASAVTGLSIADVDAGGAAMRVTLSVPTGSLAATSGGGVTVGGSSSALTLTGTVSDINAFITASNVTYTTAADANGSVTLTVLTSDQGSSGSGGTRTDSDTVTLNISAVNDTPVIAVNSTVTVLEGSTDTVITSAMLNEGDVDDSGAGLTYTLTTAPVNGTLYLSGTALVDNDTFTQADIDAGWVTYDHDGSQTGSDSFDFSLADGGEDGATVVTGTFNFNITNVNDPPVNTVPGAQSVDEDTPLTIGGVSISVNDVDDNLATVKLTVTDGVLNVTLSGATISAGSNGSSSLTLSGSQADINATLVSLTYQGNTHFNGTDTLTVLSTDGSAATDTDTVAITVNAVNDAPINTVPASIAVTEDVASAVTGLSIADVDAGGAAMRVTLSVPTGSLAATSGGGVTVGGSSSALTLTGTVSDINAFITASNVTYTTAADANGSVTLTVLTSDQGSSGSGGTRTDSDTVTLNISAVNDTPVIAVNSTVTVLEGSTDTVITSAMLNEGDVDDSGAGLTYTLTSAPVNGTLYLSGTALVDNDTFTQADIDAGWVTYDHDGSQTGSDSFDFSLADGGEDGATVVTGTFNFNITNVNDPPVNTVPGAQSVDEDTPLTIGGVSISVNDVDDNLATVKLTVTDGVLNVTLSGATISTGSNGSSSLTLSGSQADINATLVSLTYQGNTHFNGTDTLTVLSTDGSAATDTDTVAITVNAVNDAPINTVPASIAVTEDVASAVTGLSIADVDAGGAAMRVTLSVPTGSLAATSGGGVTVGGSSSALTLTGTVSDINAFITASNVTYTTAADANGSVTLTVLTSDQGSSGSGGTRTDTDTVTLNISAVNDTPVIAVNSTVTVLEGSTDTVITSAMLNEGDVDDSGAGLTYTLTTAPVNGTLYLSGTALVDNDTFTQADIDAGWVTYDHDGSQTGSDSFDFSLADGGEDGATVVTGTFNFNITNVNDPPVNTVPGAQSVDEDTPLTIGGVSISVNDVDDNLATVKLTVTDGVLNVTLSGATISAGSNGSSSLTLSGSQADINATLVSLTYQGNTHFNGTDTLTVLSTDGSAATDTDTVAITVNAVNDAPINTVPASIAVTEDVASAVTGLSIADVDAGGAAMRVTLSVPTGSLAATSGGGVTVGGSSSALTLTGTVSDINAFITASNVTYTTAADANGSVTLTVLTSDQGSSGSGGTRTDSDTVTLNISAVNDTPVIAVNSTVTVLEGSTDTVITSAMLNEGDVDDSGAGLTYTLTTAPVNGTLYLSGTALVDNDTFTQADIDAGWVTYDHDGSQTGSDSFDFSLADGGEDGATVVTGTFNFNITNVNDPPVNTVPGAQSVDEDTPLTIGGVSISVNDVDDNLATVKLTVTDGVLNVTLSGATISTGSNGSSSLTLSGSQADINATLVSLTYQGNTHFNGTDTLTVLSTDGSAATDTDTVAITINAVNDAPINTVPASIAVTEDVASAVTGLSIADVDAGGAAMRVTLSVPTGSLAATSGGGVTVGGSSSALTLTGTVSDINAFITASNVTYTTAADANGSVTLTVLTSDQGSSGSGGTRTDSDTVTLNISAVNDTPVIAVNSTVTVLEGSTDTVITSAMLNEGDVDDSGAGLTYTLTSAPVNGTLYLSGTALVDNDTFTQADIDAGWVTYDHDGSQTGSDSFDFSLADGGEDGATVVTGTFNFNITNVNDPPVNTVPGAQSVDEDTPLTIGGVSISVNDVDDNLATVKLTVTDGVLNVTLSGATISAGSNGSSSLTLSGSQADINATLVSLTYQGNTHFNGTDTLTVLSTDGSAATDTDTVAITVNAVNDAPINTVPASIAVTEDVASAVTGLSIADVDAGGAAMRVTLSVPTGSLAATSGGGVTVGGSSSALTLTGTVSDINAFITASNVTYTTAADANGSVTLTVLTSDQGSSGSGGTRTDTDTVTLNISAVNDTPTTSGLADVTVVENAADSVIDLLAAFADVENLDANLIYTIQGNTNAGLFTASTIDGAANTLTLDYALGQNGISDITIRATDNGGLFVEATFTVTVRPVADAPIAGADSYITHEGTPFTATLGVDDLLQNDSDPDGAPLTVNTTPVVDVTNGTLVLNANGTFTYTPNASFSGVDTFTYEVLNGNGGTDTATVSITVNTASNVPSAGVDSYSTDEDTAFTATLGVDDLLLNDSDLDGNTLSVNTTPVVDVTNGTLVLNANGTFTYTPNASFNGVDTFTYEISDGHGGTDTATVTITVNPVNIAPIGLPTISGTATENQTLTADTSGISDADGLGAFSYQWLRNGATIAGATGASYALGDADVGSPISVQVRYTDAGGTLEGPLTSAGTMAVINLNDQPTGIPVITGTLTGGETLSVDTSRISDNDGVGMLEYQWQRDGQDIQGANGPIYTLGDTDAGTRISVVVSYTDGEGSHERLSTAPTMKVPVPPSADIVVDPELLVTALATASFDIGTVDSSPVRLDVNTSEADTETTTKAARFDDAPTRVGGPPSPTVSPDLLDGMPAPLIMDGALIASMATDEQAGFASSDHEIPIAKKGGYPLFDLKNSLNAPLAITTSEPIVYRSVMDDTAFIDGLDQMQQELDELIEAQEKRNNLNVEAAAGFTMTLTAGFVSWALRAGSLMSSFLSVVPLWKQFDPLPILGTAADTTRRRRADAKQPENGPPDKQERVEKMFEYSDTER